MIKRLFITLLFVFLVLPHTTLAEPNEQPAPAQCYALLVGGLAGDPYSRWYHDWLTRFQTYLTKNAGVPAGNITLLSDDHATTAAIIDALGKFAKRSRPQDQFILFIVGHGEMDGEMPKLTLPGPDLTAKQLATALDAMPSKNQVILNFSAISGDFLKFLVSSDRVNITATSPTEIQEPIFAEFFLRGLESKRADADKNGTITLLEAYNWAAQQTALWIVRWSCTGPDKPDPMHPQPTIWKASGKETVEIFEKLYSDQPMRKLDPTSNRTVEDAVVDIQPPDGQITEAWQKRRIIDEHATLEDCGTPIGVSILGEKGLQLILGQNPKDPGYLASHTILGQPATPHP